uniref:Protein aurora borealis n=1 Tax=Pundamilia nyererei TaxID=303518 RepID=A0A3B4F571_9CICH
MGDHAQIQITPETPGRPSIRNPFESPNDYHHLREPLVPSPSVFKSLPCKATPPKFNWSIDEMASLLPVHIDPEEIQRQSFYLSQTRTDSDIEEKRQNAIEQFFTKGIIVPSPWAAPETRKVPQISKNSKLSYHLCYLLILVEEPEKISENQTICCQVTVSVFCFCFFLTGEYYRYEEVCDPVQESLSSSSLRRKLFLDGQNSYSGSDSSSPPRDCIEASEGEAVSAIFSSPSACGVSAPTPSTGQFSSSPIQHGRFRDCSLGSIDSPLFRDRSSPAGLISPTISPIVAHAERTPVATGNRGRSERNQPSCLTPRGAPLDIVASCSESPFVEGCSPIRSCSPHQPRPRGRCWASPPLISPILNPKLPDNEVAEEHLPSATRSSFPSMELDSSSPLTQDSHPTNTERVGVDPMEPVKMEEGKETEIEPRLEYEEDEGVGPSEQLTSSRMVNASATENSHMFVSLLAEGSSIRYDSSMQVDSGYNTTSAVSLIDGTNKDCDKEFFSSHMAEDAFQVTRHTKVKHKIKTMKPDDKSILTTDP